MASSQLVEPRFASREAAFERVYREHRRDVYRYALALVGNRQDAEDATQTTFLKAFRALARDGRVENERAWLLAIAQNVCRERFRTATRRPQEVELDPDLADAHGDEDTVSASDIRAAMDQLAFNQRTVLILREIEGRSYAEVADAMGLSVSAVETLLFRARRALREQLEAAERSLGCQDVRALVSVDKVPRADRSHVRAHLRVCAPCASHARRLRARKKVLSSLGPIPMPAGLVNALQPLGERMAAKAAALTVGAAIVGTGGVVASGVHPASGWSAGEAVAQRPAPAVPRAAPSAVPEVGAALDPIRAGAIATAERPAGKRKKVTRDARPEASRARRAPRAERAARPTKAPGAKAKAQKATKPDKPDKPTKREKAARPAKPEKRAKPKPPAKPAKPAKPERARGQRRDRDALAAVAEALRKIPLPPASPQVHHPHSHPAAGEPQPEPPGLSRKLLAPPKG